MDGFKGLALRTSPKRPSFYMVSEFLDNIRVEAPMIRTDFWPDPTVSEDGEFKELQNFMARSTRRYTYPNGAQPDQKVIAISWSHPAAGGISTEELLLLALRILHRKGCLGIIIGGCSGMDKLGRELVEGKVGWLEALADKEYRSRGGTFAFPSPLDTFVRGLHRRTQDLHEDWQFEGRGTAGEEAKGEAVAEMLLRLRWDESQVGSRVKLSLLVARIWGELGCLLPMRVGAFVPIEARLFLRIMPA